MRLQEICLDKVRAELLERQRVYTIQYAIARAVAHFLNMNNERAVSKRLATGLEPALRGYAVGYSGGTITIWGGSGEDKLSFENAVTFRLEQHPETFNFDAKRTIEHWRFTRYSTLNETVADMRTLLSSLPSRVSAYNHAVRQLDEAEKLLGHMNYVVDNHNFRK